MSFYPALAGRTAGVLEIQKSQVIFTYETDAVKIIIPTSNLHFKLEGVNSQHFYLYDVLRPEISICVQNPQAMYDLQNFGINGVEKILQQTMKMRTKRRLSGSSPFVVIFLLILAVPFILSMLPVMWLEKVLSSEHEKTLGRWLFPVMKLQFQIIEDHPAQEKVNALSNYIRSATPELAKLDLRIYLSSSPEVNAFAAPGNIIVINKGLIKEADTIEEIAGVLAHEFGHIEQKHTLKALAGRVGSLIGTIILASVIGADAALITLNTTDFVILKYSRDDEFAADKRGFHFLSQSKISTQGMIQFFNKLAAAKAVLPSFLTFASTHPSSDDRVLALQQLSQKFPDQDLKALPVSLAELQLLVK